MSKLLPLCFILAVCLASLHAQSARELCENGKGKFDVIVSTADNDVYVIKGDRVWRLIGDKDRGFRLDKSGYPKPVGAVWAGLPGHLDTAFTDYQQARTYFFKDSKVWVYQGRGLLPGYPKQATSEFRNLPSAIDGAFVCTGVNYFFKGNQVFAGRQGTFQSNIAHKWRGLPDNMHAAIQFPSRGHTFFFKDYQFYKYRVYNGPVEPGYPKDVVPFWFQCEEQQPEQQPEQEPEAEPDYDVPQGEIETESQGTP